MITARSVNNDQQLILDADDYLADPFVNGIRQLFQVAPNALYVDVVWQDNTIRYYRTNRPYPNGSERHNVGGD